MSSRQGRGNKRRAACFLSRMASKRGPSALPRTQRRAILQNWPRGKEEESREESQTPEMENDQMQREYTKLAIETTMRCEERREEEEEKSEKKEREGKYGKKSLHCQGNGDIERNIRSAGGNQNMLKIRSNCSNHTTALSVNVFHSKRNEQSRGLEDHDPQWTRQGTLRAGHLEFISILETNGAVDYLNSEK
ncbi:hypothetical protein BJY00DRAFT_194459 [Aspergillus carlsbadensis]|nr:hypothetical protein BJY00DRAFT_194459 [Aspergillus carlsbadensis]